MASAAAQTPRPSTFCRAPTSTTARASRRWWDACSGVLRITTRSPLTGRVAAHTGAPAARSRSRPTGTRRQRPTTGAVPTRRTAAPTLARSTTPRAPPRCSRATFSAASTPSPVIMTRAPPSVANAPSRAAAARTRWQTTLRPRQSRTTAAAYARAACSPTRPTSCRPRRSTMAPACCPPAPTRAPVTSAQRIAAPFRDAQRGTQSTLTAWPRTTMVDAGTAASFTAAPTALQTILSRWRQFQASVPSSLAAHTRRRQTSTPRPPSTMVAARSILDAPTR